MHGTNYKFINQTSAIIFNTSVPLSQQNIMKGQTSRKQA